MQGLAPVVQTEDPASGGAALQAETGQAEPLINGPAPALWAGAGAVLLIFVVGMMLIIRGRVTPNKTMKDQKESRSFFEPAGEGADITFDEDEDSGFEAAPPKKHRESWIDEDAAGVEITIDHETASGSLHEEEPVLEEAPPAPVKPEKQKRPAFAGLFSRKAETRVEETPKFAEAEPDDEAFHVNDADDDLGFFAPEPESEPVANPEPEPRATPQHFAEAEDRRLAVAEETARDAIKRAEKAEAFARDLERANAEAKHAMSLEVQKREAALQESAEAMAAMERRLAAMSDEFQERIEAASADADKMTEAPESLAAYHDAPPIVSEEHFAEFANLMGEQFDVLRGEVNSAVEKLSKRLDNLPTAPGAATATAARVQLTDLLGDALAPQRYKLNHRLPTGRTAEAAILMPGPMAPVAIDARFPVEAFDAWQLSRNAGTETELRRAVLRNIADAGEKLIVAEETADCAMMFIPSENILSELHAHFSDLVQESYRARVFMVSPTSLMATLHTISAVLAGAGVRETSAMSFLDELHALRARVAALETVRQNGAAAAKTEKPAAAKPAIIQGAPHYSFDRPPHKGGEGDDKSPFPLR